MISVRNIFTGSEGIVTLNHEPMPWEIMLLVEYLEQNGFEVIGVPSEYRQTKNYDSEAF